MPTLLLNLKLFSGRSLLRVLLLGSLILSFALGFWLVNYLQIKKIVNPNQVPISLIKPIYGQNIVLFNITDFQNQIKANNPLVREVLVNKTYPQTLIVKTRPEKGVAQLENKDQILLLNDQGKILSLHQKLKAKLPLISYYQTLRTHETKPNALLKNQDLQYALKLINKKDDLPFELKQITIKKPGQILIIPVEDSPLIIINHKKNIAKNLYILQNIIKSLTKQGTKPKKIDLQFDKPIVTL